MKKLYLLAAIMIGMTLAAAAQTSGYDFRAVSPSGDTLYYSIDSTGLIVTYPNSSALTGEQAWVGYTRPSGELIIPATVDHDGQTYTVKTIGDAAFSNCSDITDVSIAATVRVIGSGAFAYCTGLTGIDIPNGVLRIGEGAFLGCSAITSATLGKNLYGLGRNAFKGCTAITAITALPATPPRDLLASQSASLDAFDGVDPYIPVYIPCGSAEAYAQRWSQFSNFAEMFFPTIEAVSDDPSNGTAAIVRQPSCQNDTALAAATPAEGFRFARWSDGSTDNPYSLRVTDDIVLTAYFEADSIVGIDAAAAAAPYTVRTLAGSIEVEGIGSESVRIFDCTGRCLLSTPATERVLFQAPAAGIYLLQVGNRKAEKVQIY